MQQINLKENISEFGHFNAIKANDESALRKLYEDNYDTIEKYVLNNNGTTEDAKDIYQEAFIVVWRNIQLDKFYPENKNALAGYLYRIAKNKWLDHLRSGHYRKIIRINDSADSVPEDLLPEEDIEYITEIKNKFKHLGENCRKVLTRFYYKKEPLRVIAEKFGWTEATAKNNKYRCLQHLRELLKNKINP
ncbi:MAG: sigma-70 family RNA polymerase sigma factor [Ginsengibacter sp.]